MKKAKTKKDQHKILFGKWVKKERLAKKIKQEEISEAAGLASRQQISNIERGINLPTPRIIKAFCKLTKVKEQTMLNKLYSVQAKRFTDRLKNASAN